MNPTGRPVLSVCELTKSFGGLTALSRVSMDVASGAVHGLIGPNGSGKTTLINCISGLYRPSAGRVLLNGRDVTHWLPHQLARAGIARTFQTPRLFDRATVLENVLVSIDARRGYRLGPSLARTSGFMRDETGRVREAWELLARVGLDSSLYHVPAKALSYGQRRLLEIARALASRPEVLLLDEPTAGMNDTEKDHVIRLIAELNRQGVTVLIVEHAMQVIMSLCHRITVLNQGAVLVEGPPSEVQQDPRVVEAYLGWYDEAAS